jgi:UDP-galactopyranose mutase
VTVVLPTIPDLSSRPERRRLLARLLDGFVAEQGIQRPTAWYYAPQFLPWARHLDASAVVYDAMDELSAFQGAPPELHEMERELLAAADLVFTGGRSLFEAKRTLHPDVHAFPSSVDAAHFRAARSVRSDPPDQAAIPHPRLGWFGVIDERVDLGLLDEVARRRTDWSIVLVGPIAKIDESSIPVRPNIHRLGQKAYDDLPAYLAGWDVAIMPFARNAATRYISPTKTPEYLAGGRPVVSTPIRDVMTPYGERGLVRVTEGPAGFIAACEAALAQDPAPVMAAADRFLAGMSWHRTWAEMDALVGRAARRHAVTQQKVALTGHRPAVARSLVGDATPAATVATMSSAATPRSVR